MVKAKLPDGAILDTDRDICVWRSPHNPPGTGDKYLWGHDLYMVPAYLMKGVYYLHQWSLTDKIKETIYLLNTQKANEFLNIITKGSAHRIIAWAEAKGVIL